ncbi:MAG: polymerase sigma-54 factor RpoN [Myxococcaceae bacterium]|nr:polymerase sigma-54 factor RpoN [Myxococcaceae bacterium]
MNLDHPLAPRALAPAGHELSLLADEQLVARVCAGEVDLFAVLMRRNNARVYRAARAILKRDDEAEDVMQDAYVRAFEHLSEFKGEARFSTWLTRIAVHEALARIRRARCFESLEQRTQESSFMPIEPRATPERQLLNRELADVLDRAVDALPDEFRLVFVLRTVEQLSGAETADVLQIPEQTVKTRLFRARERLKKDIASALDTPEATYAFHLARCDRVVRAVMARIGAPLREPRD